MVSLAQGPSGAAAIFLIHASDGSAGIYDPMKEVFEGKQQVWVLEDGNYAASNVRERDTFEAMATAYAQTIRSLCPSGPLCVGGYSLGGLLAYLAAQELRKEGAEVERLLLIEAPDPNVEVVKRGLGGRIQSFLQSAREQKASVAGALLRRVVSGAIGRVRFEVENRLATILPTKPRSYLRGVHIRQLNEALFDGASPLKPYEGEVRLWECQDQGDKFEVVGDRPWKVHLPALKEVWEVPGNHLGILEPAMMKRLAQEIHDDAPTARRSRSSA